MAEEQRDPYSESQTPPQDQGNIEATDVPISNLPVRSSDLGETEPDQSTIGDPERKQINPEKLQLRNLALTERFVRHFILLVFVSGITLGVGGGFIPKITTETVTEGEETRIVRIVTTGDPIVQGIGFLFAGLAISHVLQIPVTSIAKVILYYVSRSLANTSAIMDRTAESLEKKREDDQTARHVNTCHEKVRSELHESTSRKTESVLCFNLRCVSAIAHRSNTFVYCFFG